MFVRSQNPSSSSPNIKVENLGSHLFCSINYSGKIYECKISVDELHSGMMSLLKLQNILKSYETIIQNPHYQFKFEIHENERTSTKHLILHIVFSDDYIDWEEKIYFREKCIIEQEEAENNLLKQQVQMQQKQIEKMENIIQNLEKDITINLRYRDSRYNNNHTIQKLPKKVDVVTIYFVENYRLLSFDYRNDNNDIISKHIRTLDLITHEHKISDFGKNLAKCDYNVMKFYFHNDYKFLDYYLFYKKNVFIINTINVDNEYFQNNLYCLKKYLDVLVKYANYKKLIFPFNKEFNDAELKTHCETNGIEYICE